MKPEFSIEKYKKNADIIRQTAEQVKKDFALFSLNVEFTGNEDTAYDELFTQIRPFVEKLSGENFEKFSHLLYRIDVPEKDLKEVYAIRPSAAMFDVLTNLILNRELLKVCYRNLYK